MINLIFLDKIRLIPKKNGSVHLSEHTQTGLSGDLVPSSILQAVGGPDLLHRGDIVVVASVTGDVNDGVKQTICGTKRRLGRNGKIWADDGCVKKIKKHQ